MPKKVLIGGLVGGLILFVWLGLAWTVWHPQQFKQIPQDKALAAELVARDMKSGLYYLPGPPPKSGGKEAMQAYDDAVKAGPVVSFLAYQEHGTPMSAMPLLMLKGFCYCLLACFAAAWLMTLAAPAVPGYGQRVLLCTAIGAAAALSGPAMLGNFFSFPPLHVFLEIFDQVMGWTLVGLWLAVFCRAKRPAGAQNA
jgi:hypothetical protein